MRPAAAAALMFAGLVACSGYTNGQFYPSASGGPPIVGSSSDAGDAGPDAGDGGPDAGDAGSDAGCAPLTLNGVPAVDYCPNGIGVPTAATGTVNTANCTIDISIGTSNGPCRGAVSGGAHAFDGGCQSGFYACSSSSLPGTLTCFYGTTGGTCKIRICDAGTACL